MSAPDRLRAAFAAPATQRQAAVLVVLALVVRLGAVLWAHGRFPPADDGHFYHVVAERIAAGLGYTWLWPDGAVTYAAHYPVGYPALIGAVYALFGSAPTLAMGVNAAFGALGVWGVHRIARSVVPGGPAFVAGLVVALHPSLVAYTPALMTEGVTAALLAILGAMAVSVGERTGRWVGPLRLGIGALAGLAVLIRPQSLLLAPVFGAFSASGARARVRAALLVSVVAIGVCLPWTFRNCARMDRCVLVSANMGWNLFIGAAEGATGTWVSIDELGVPTACREVFGEADKDRCFGEAGLDAVLRHPLRYLGLVPAKLLATFDWSGAPGHYLHTSNPAAFGARAKLALGIAEAVVQRLVVLAALLALARAPGANARARRLLAALAIPLLFVRLAWLAHIVLVAQALLLGRALTRRPDAALAAAVVGTTLATHAVFFGAGRYGLVCVPVLVALAGAALVPRVAGERAL
ncbi:MAG TPA: glycosyltransferase family 39 protein [Polyangiaceae bacterium]|nr:glycosyltransferase family 39 protein [Polyangiaceae bacterium]